jgi:hypothetical protein
MKLIFKLNSKFKFYAYNLALNLLLRLNKVYVKGLILGFNF